MSMFAVLFVAQSLMPAATNNITLIADYPHLVVDKLKAVESKEAAGAKKPALLHKDNVALMNLATTWFASKTKAAVANPLDPKGPKRLGGELGSAMTIAKATPPPTREVLHSLAKVVMDFVNGLSALAGNDKEAPNPETLNLKVLILTDYSPAGWCDVSLKGSGQQVEGDSAFATLRSLGDNYDSTDTKQASLRNAEEKLRASNKAPLLDDYVAAFTDPKTGKLGDDAFHNDMLKKWWQARLPVLKRLIDEKYLPGNSLGKRLTFEVREYNVDKIQASAKKKQTATSDKFSLWLSQSPYRDDWSKTKPILNDQGKALDPKNDAIAKKLVMSEGKTPLADSLKAYNSNNGGWPTKEHRQAFCKGTASGRGLDELMKLMDAVPPKPGDVDKPVSQRSLEPMFSEGLVPGRGLMVEDLQGAQKEWANRRDNGAKLTMMGQKPASRK